MSLMLDARSKVKNKMLAAVAVAALLAGIGVSLDKLSLGESLRIADGPREPEPVSSAGVQVSADFVSLAKSLRPVVVNISATQGERQRQSPFGRNDLPEDRFGLPRPPNAARERTSQGSGFIIDREGSILTSQHLVEGAKKIVVKMSDGKEFEAKVIGQDSLTDIAVIEIKTGQSLTTAPLGNSDQLEVGEWVMAIGNPYGLDNSVTAGIVSAKGRFIGAGPYDDFIQTDASVNPGNSGGPLVNLRGEVVGINAAIVSQTGANIGIGFALPINLVKELLPQLKEAGKITRGWLGVNIQRLTPEIAESLGVKSAHGALVSAVSKDGPAHRAGIQAADIIIEFDGQPIKDARELPLIVAREPVDKKAQLKILRDKKQLTLNVTIGELKDSGATGGREELG